jgi:hypothetical protein
MEVMHSAEMSVNIYQTTRRHILQGLKGTQNLHSTLESPESEASPHSHLRTVRSYYETLVIRFVLLIIYVFPTAFIFTEFIQSGY